MFSQKLYFSAVLTGAIILGVHCAIAQVSSQEEKATQKLEGLEEQIEIKLDAIEKIHAQERGGDELYISVTEFPTTGRATHYQIPSFPSHWLSNYLKGVKGVVLWHKPFKTCEPVNVIISLVEEDLPPWNLDDLLGSIELKVTCEQGKIATQWHIPNKTNTTKIDHQENAFSFSGKHGEYHAVFSFKKGLLKHEAQNFDKNDNIQTDHIYLPI